jgi:hypothetical protein
VYVEEICAETIIKKLDANLDTTKSRDNNLKFMSLSTYKIVWLT